MKFVVEDGTGLSLANSFCSVRFADDFCENNGLTAWGAAALSPGDQLLKKQQSLVAGSRWLSVTYGWLGYKTHNFQSLAFPRIHIHDYPESLFPEEIRQAAVLAALRIYKGQQLSPDLKNGGHMQSVKAGPVTVVYGKESVSSRTVYREIDDLVADYSYSGSTGSPCITVGLRK